MSNDKRTTEHAVLTELLDQGKYRKTPERYVVFDAVCGMKKPFTIDELEEALDVQHVMRLCRSTLYNTLNLLLKLKLVVKQKFKAKTMYVLSLPGSTHCWMICNECGRTKEILLPDVAKMLADLKLKGFRKESAELYLHGICSDCHKKTVVAKRKKNARKHKVTVTDKN